MSRLYDLNIDDSEGLTNQRGGGGFQNLSMKHQNKRTANHLKDNWPFGVPENFSFDWQAPHLLINYSKEAWRELLSPDFPRISLSRFVVTIVLKKCDMTEEATFPAKRLRLV